MIKPYLKANIPIKHMKCHQDDLTHQRLATAQLKSPQFMLLYWFLSFKWRPNVAQNRLE